MTRSAGCGKVDFGNRAGRFGSALQIVSTVTVGADCRRTPFFVWLAVHRSRVAGKADRQSDKVGCDDAGVAVTLAASLGNAVAIDEAGSVVDRFDVVTGVAIGASGGGSVAVESRHAVDAGTIGSFNFRVASAATKGLFLARVSDLVSSVTREAVHLTLFEEGLVNSADELVAITGVAFVTGGDDALIKVRLVSRMDVVTRRATHDAARSDGFAVGAGFDLLHRAGVAAFAELVDCAGGRRKGGGVSRMAAYATGGRLASFGGDSVNRAVVATGFAIVTATTGVFSGAQVERFDLVRVASSGMTGGAVGGFG